MELRQFLSSIEHGWRIILVTVILGLLVPAAQEVVVGRAYVSTAQLYVHVVSARNIDDLASANSLVQQQVSDYAQLAVTPAVLSPAATASGTGVTAGELTKDVVATAPDNSAFLDLAATAQSPKEAQEIAEAVSKRLVTYAAELTPTNATTGARLVLSEVSPAGLPAASSTSALLVQLLIGAIIGAVVGIAIVVLRERFRARFRSVAEVAAVTSSEVLGRIPGDRRARGQTATDIERRSPARFDALRSLRASLGAYDLLPDRGSTIAVTSAVAGEGKSSVVAGLAVALAAAGRQVVVVEGDLRRPRLFKHFKVAAGLGLTDVLAERVALNDVLFSTQDPNIRVLRSGSAVPRASELLASDAMIPVLMDLAADDTVVLIDTPPLLEISDAAVLARWADHVLLVVGAPVAREREVVRAIAVLRQVRVKAAGLVVNQVPRFWTDADSTAYVADAPLQ